MSELGFEVLDIRPERHAISPTLQVLLRIEEHTGERVHSMALRAQLRIDAQRRGYEPEERAGVRDLFGEPAQWGETLKPFLWTQTSLMVQGFRERTEVELPVPVSYDVEVAGSKYLHALRGGQVPLSLLFGGTLFTRGGTGFAVEHVPWHHDVSYSMPVSVWTQLVEQHFPDTGWLRLEHGTIAALQRYKSARSIPDWDQAMDALLTEAGGESG